MAETKLKKTSAGVLIVYKGKALMAHATNSPWWHSYTPPKGGVEPGENEAAAAARELKEEVGITVDPKKFADKVRVEYRDKKDVLYKIVWMFVLPIENLSEIGLKEESVPRSQLQLEEVDEAVFMDAKTVMEKSLPRYVDYILPYLL